MNNFDIITEVLEENFQRYIEIEVNNRVVRKGTLILYQIKDFYLSVFLKTSPDSPSYDKKYDIPYPFKILPEKNKLTFEYRLDNIVIRDYNNMSNHIKTKNTNRLLNNNLTINFK